MCSDRSTTAEGPTRCNILIQALRNSLKTSKYITKLKTYLLRIHENNLENEISNGPFFLFFFANSNRDTRGKVTFASKNTAYDQYVYVQRRKWRATDTSHYRISLPFSIILYSVLFDNTGVRRN